MPSVDGIKFIANNVFKEVHILEAEIKASSWNIDIISNHLTINKLR